MMSVRPAYDTEPLAAGDSGLRLSVGPESSARSARPRSLGSAMDMRLTSKILWSVGCLLASLFITWLAWEMAIDGRAFHCTDAGTLSLAFWTNAETHRSAGDLIQPGWTWEKLGFVNQLYTAAFLVLWVSGSMLSSRLIGGTPQVASRVIVPNQPNAAKPAIAPRLHANARWRGLADSDRSAE
jgi:hypothetical protein